MGGPILATRAPLVQARAKTPRDQKWPESARYARDRLHLRQLRTDSTRDFLVQRLCAPVGWIMTSSLPVVSFDREAHSNGSVMTDNNHERGRQTGRPAKKDARQDRLKLALRENLKRRKSQARGRDEVANSSDKGLSQHRGETKPGS
jgi:hypothetical protein